MKQYSIFIGITILLLGGVYFFLHSRDTEQVTGYAPAAGTEVSFEQGFLGRGLLTNTEKSSIDQSLIFSGGPGKDGIPSIDEPAFTSVAGADVLPDTLGILVEFDGEKRYYPYSILVWHEIVNDTVGDTHFAATFCPLCGSGVVFNRDLGDTIVTFGVSGMLYESNLLMYDRGGESLWSQARGEAVVGERTGTKLEILPMQLLSFAEVQAHHSEARVLSTDTGHGRNYGRNPYSGYEETEGTYFPISIEDNRFFGKTIMYVIPRPNASIVFAMEALKEGSTSTFEHGGKTYTAKKENSAIVVTEDGFPVPGYYEMWFSWVQHHQDNGVVWKL